MTAGTAPTAYDLVATQGADFSIIFSFTQADGGLTGTTATCSILTTAGAAATVSSFTGSLNVTSDTTATFTASLTSTQIATLVATGTTTFKYALNTTKSALVTPWLAGQLSFLQPGVGTTTASGSFTITAGANTITGTLTVAANAAVNVSVTDPADAFAATTVEAALLEAVTAWKHKQSRAFLRNLGQSDRPETVVVMGDSTGITTARWVYQMAQWLGTSYPAYNVDYREWDDTAQGWGANTRIQTGTAGDPYLATDGATNRIFQAPDSTTLSPTGDISVRVKFQPTGSWTALAADSELFNKFDIAGNRSWRFILKTNGTLVFEHASDGSTLKTKQSTAAVGFASGALGWVRADLDVDNGASGYNVLFYTSPDGSTWTQLGSTVTTATATSVFDSTAVLMVGSRSGSGITQPGKIYQADFYSGITATPTLLASWQAGEMWRSATSGALTGYDVAGNLWTGNSLALAQNITGAPTITIRNASVSGQALAYFTDVTRFAKINTGRVRLTFTSLSHNEGGTYNNGGDLYYTDFDAFLTQIVTLNPSTGVVVVGQNPKTSPQTTDQIHNHQDRIRALCELAGVRNHGWIDVYTAMISNTATYVSNDGIHPTTAGFAVWLALTEHFLMQS